MSPTNGGPGGPAVREFRKILTDGVQTDIYLAFESHGIAKTIGERVPAANASTFQPALLARRACLGAWDSVPHEPGVAQTQAVVDVG